MLNLSTSGFGDEPTPVSADVNGTNYAPGMPPAPIKSLPGQMSFFDAGGFFSDDAKPMEQAITAKPAEPASAAEPIVAPFVDDTPPFDVPATAAAEEPKPEPEPSPIPLPPIVSESLPNPVAAMPEAPTVEERGAPAAAIVEVSDAEAEYLYNEKLQSMETELAQLDLLVLAAKDELKSVSKEQQHAAKSLRGFKARGLESFKQKLLEERQAEADEAAEAQAAADAIAEAAAEGKVNEHGEIVKPSRDKTTAEEKPPFVPMVEPDSTETNWQNISVRELKINPKIIKRLIEAKIDTLEKLEWRRRAVHDGAESWPAGIGAKKIEEIENGIVQWFSERNAPAGDAAEAMEQVGDIIEPVAAKKPRKPRKKKEAVDTDGAGEINYEHEPSTSDASDAAEDTIDDELTEEEHEEAILAESQVILAQGPDAFKDPPADPELCRRWDGGYECCQSGGAVTDCIAVPGQHRTAWIKGWLAADASMRN